MGVVTQVVNSSCWRASVIQSERLWVQDSLHINLHINSAALGSIISEIAPAPKSFCGCLCNFSRSVWLMAQSRIDQEDVIKTKRHCLAWNVRTVRTTLRIWSYQNFWIIRFEIPARESWRSHFVPAWNLNRRTTWFRGTCKGAANCSEVLFSILKPKTGCTKSVESMNGPALRQICTWLRGYKAFCACPLC